MIVLGRLIPPGCYFTPISVAIKSILSHPHAKRLSIYYSFSEAHYKNAILKGVIILGRLISHGDASHPHLLSNQINSESSKHALCVSTIILSSEGQRFHTQIHLPHSI